MLSLGDNWVCQPAVSSHCHLRGVQTTWPGASGAFLLNFRGVNFSLLCSPACEEGANAQLTDRASYRVCERALKSVLDGQSRGSAQPCVSAGAFPPLSGSIRATQVLWKQHCCGPNIASPAGTAKKGVSEMAVLNVGALLCLLGCTVLGGHLSPSAPRRPLNPLLYEWGRSCPSRALWGEAAALPLPSLCLDAPAGRA